MVKITFEGAAKRVYTETRGERTDKYVVVDDGAGKHPNVLRFRLKPNSAIAVAEGAKVKVSAYVDGREWTNNEGKTLYFTDLTVDTVDVLSAPAPAAPTTASDWKSLLALGAAYGEDADAVTERCKARKEKVNRAFTPEDWQGVADEIVAAHKPADAAQSNPFEDDCPF